MIPDTASPTDVYKLVNTLNDRIWWMSAIIIGLVFAQLIGKYLLYSRVLSLVIECRRLLKMVETHGLISDVQKQVVTAHIQEVKQEVVQISQKVDETKRSADKVAEKLAGDGQTQLLALLPQNSN